MTGSIRLYHLELLARLSGQLSDSVLVGIIDDLHKTAAFGRLKTNHARCCIGINIANLESEEIARTPIINNLARSVIIFNCTRELALSYAYIFL